MSKVKLNGSGERGSASKILEPAFKSAKEIEDGISSTSTVKWNPFNVFPKEIYFMIFNNLDNPTDKQNFMNAHVKFYDLFKAERVKFLVGQLFGILPEDEEESKPFWWRKTEQSLLRLRLVCHAWDESIQSYFQLHPYHFDLRSCNVWETRPRNEYQRVPKGNSYVIREGPPGIQTRRPGLRILSSDMDKFKASSSKNPFLSRKVTITILSSNFERIPRHFRSSNWSHLDSIDDLMQTYGQHIWHFALSAPLSPEIYSRVMEWLHLMPELRTLKMDFEHGSVSPHFELPELTKLQNLHVHNFPSFDLNKLLKGMKALKIIEVDQPLPYDQLEFPIKLTEAALTFTGSQDFQYLKNVKNPQLLSKLIINENNLAWNYIANFMDLSSKCESTIWQAFPNLENLTVYGIRTRESSRQQAYLYKKGRGGKIMREKIIYDKPNYRVGFV